MSILSAFKSSVTTLVLLATIAIPVHATVTTTGDVDPGDATDPWAVDGTLKVGNSGNGTLGITVGGEVTNTSVSYDGFIGRYPDSFAGITSWAIRSGPSRLASSSSLPDVNPPVGFPIRRRGLLWCSNGPAAEVGRTVSGKCWPIEENANFTIA